MDRWTLPTTILVALILAGCAGAKVRPEPGAPVAAGPATEQAREDAPAHGPEAPAASQRAVRVASPYLGAEPIELSTPMSMGGPAARPPDAATPRPRVAAGSTAAASRPSTAPADTTVTTVAPRHSSAAGGALNGLGVVLKIWAYACIVGGPLTLALCIVGFPEYWPYAVMALVGGVAIGAVVGAVADSVAGGGSSGRPKGRRRPRRRVRGAPPGEPIHLFGGGNWSRAVS
jgi:hypothetical protein